jgi:hypothetical protein
MRSDKPQSSASSSKRGKGVSRTQKEEALTEALKKNLQRRKAKKAEDDKPETTGRSGK